MKSLIQTISQLIVENSEQKAFNSKEIALFKFLNKNKGSLQTKADYKKFITRFLNILGMPREDALYYYYLYSSNYMPDGNYEDLKKGQERRPGEGGKPTKTSNIKMSDFARNTLPFRGSNVEGFWERDPKGEPQYVITSYNWYPIYIFKDNKWFKVSDSYSSSTGKQIGQTRIHNYSAILTPKEISALRKGQELSVINMEKQENLVAGLKKLLMGRQYQFATIYLPPSQNNPNGKYRIKFTLNFVDKIGDDTVIDIDIIEITLMDYLGQVISRYTPEEITDEFKTNITKGLGYWLNEKLDSSLLGVSNLVIKPDFKV
jgi:hypothetical protein